MADESEEKEFDPTPQKLQEARRKGEIAKSADINTAAAYLGFLICLYFVFEHSIAELGSLFISIFELIDTIESIKDTATSVSILKSIIRETATSTLAIFAVPALLVVASVLIQRSFTFALSKIEPKLNRISIISGLKNKFGRVGIFEFLKSFCKLIFFIGVLAIFIHINFDRIAVTSRISPGAALLSIGRLLYVFMFIIFGLSLIIGILDLSFQHAEHIRKNRMTRKEFQDELKQSEGDPLIKQRRRQKALALASNSMLAEVPDSSVVIVNPTHFSVALKWDPNTAAAPIVVAKGVDEIALKIREIALESGVPVHSNPPAARALFADAPIGEPIHPDHYAAVAAAIRFADDIRRRRKRSYGEK